MLAFIGSRTTRERNARGVGLSVYEVMDGGAWRLLQTVDLINPSYLLVDPDRRTIYTVHGDLSDISAFSIGADQRLTLLNQRSTLGRNPVHLAWDDHRRHLVVANYATGSLACLPVATDGSLGEVASTLQFTGTPGPRHHDQTGAHPHQVLWWPGTNLFVVPDKGLDRLHLVELDTQGGLRLCGDWHATPGAGCRHAVAHASRKLLWVVNELDSTVTTCCVDASACHIEALDTVSLLPAAHYRTSTGAGIVRHGDMLHVSIRGLDAVVSLRIDPRTGHASPVQTTSTHGATPRFIAMTPDERHLLVANETSDTLMRLSIRDDGLPGEPEQIVSTGSPVCVALLS